MKLTTHTLPSITGLLATAYGHVLHLEEGQTLVHDVEESFRASLHALHAHLSALIGATAVLPAPTPTPPPPAPAPTPLPVITVTGATETPDAAVTASAASAATVSAAAASDPAVNVNG